MTNRNILQDVSFHVLNYNNPDRRERMIQRFKKLDIPFTFVTTSDIPYPHNTMVNHVNMITEFYNTGKKYGILCEDDIYLRKTLKEDLPSIISTFEQLKLDILLLGYLLPYRLHNIINHHVIPFTLKGNTYHDYDDSLCGSQMYLISRQHAKCLIDMYHPDKFIKEYPKGNSVDYLITKQGNRAMLYPMLAVEEGTVNTDVPEQVNFHRICAQTQYNPDMYY